MMDGVRRSDDHVAPRFPRYEPLRRAAGLVLGMLSGLPRKNCWTIAEHRGDVSPDGLPTCWAGRGGTPTRFATSAGDGTGGKVDLDAFYYADADHDRVI
jgi:hypothetical protein